MKNSYIELPAKEKYKIDELVLRRFKRLKDELEENNPKDVVSFLMGKFEESIRSYEAQKWFEKERELKDNAELIAEYTEIINKLKRQIK